KKNTDEGKSETGITETNHVNPFALPCIRYASNTNDRTFDNATINEFSLLTEDSTAIESYLHKHPGSTPYHRPCVLRTIQTTFLHDCRYWVAKRESQICGVLPLVQLKSRLFGNYCVSMPFFNYGGVLADDVIVAQQLLKHASSWAINRGAKHVEYRYASDTHFDLPHKSDKVSFYLSLPETSEALRQSFKSKLRSQIKKAQSYPHQVRHGGAELVDDFYRVFSENMRDLGTPVYDKQLFRNLAITLGNRLSVTVIYYDNNPAAAAILIGHKHRLEIPWASTLRTHNPKSVNMLLYWEVLQWAIQKNYRVFDFGRCSTDAGTYKFKAQWGATELPLHWDYQLFNGEMPALNTKNIKYKFLISVWKRLPVFVANTLGPHVVKYLP
ncbi:MAG: FemAB family PEP-CTERM system-associated protein, partial [Gammaproteobacteria bacterium]